MPGWTFHSVNSVDEIEAFQFQFLRFCEVCRVQQPRGRDEDPKYRRIHHTRRVDTKDTNEERNHAKWGLWNPLAVRKRERRGGFREGTELAAPFLTSLYIGIGILIGPAFTITNK